MRDPEITMELNPDDMSMDRLSAWKMAGINRLSIGVQSFFNEDLLWMNRSHNADQAVHAINNARFCWFRKLQPGPDIWTPCVNR